MENEYDKGYAFADRMVSCLGDRLLRNLMEKLGEEERGTLRDRLADAFVCGFREDRQAEINKLREALQPLAALEVSSIGSIPDDQAWLWKPSQTSRLDCPGINVAHVRAAKLCLAEYAGRTAKEASE